VEDKTQNQNKSTMIPIHPSIIIKVLCHVVWYSVMPSLQWGAKMKSNGKLCTFIYFAVWL